MTAIFLVMIYILVQMVYRYFFCVVSVKNQTFGL